MAGLGRRRRPPGAARAQARLTDAPQPGTTNPSLRVCHTTEPNTTRIQSATIIACSDSGPSPREILANHPDAGTC